MAIRSNGFPIHPSTVALLVMAVAMLALFSCKKGDAQKVAEISKAPNSSTETQPPSPSSPKSAVPPVNTEPIEVKLDRIAKQAHDTKREYEVFRNRLFNAAFEQLDVILCSAYRLQLLRGKENDFYKSGPALYLGPLRSILKRQGSRPFLELSETNTRSAYDSAIIVDEIKVSIPKSAPYTEKSRPIASLAFRESLVESADSDQAGDPKLEKTLSSATWHFDPRRNCEASYLAPIASSPQARHDSTQNMATLISSSLQSLRNYPAKLEDTEREWTRANDLTPLLNSLKRKIEFNRNDPTARAEAHIYEQSLAKAASVLSRGTGGPGDAADPEEIKRILALF